MKKDNKKDRDVYTLGRPSLEKLSKNELKVFYSTLLSCVVEHYKENPKKCISSQEEKRHV